MYKQHESISLPNGLADQLKQLYGPQARIVAQAPVSGGDINEAYHLVMQDGRDLFLKTHPDATDEFFSSEAAGLAARLREERSEVPRLRSAARLRACQAPSSRYNRVHLRPPLWLPEGQLCWLHAPTEPSV